MDHAAADRAALSTLSHCLPALDETGVKLCLEPLTTAETDFLTTAAEAVGLVRRLGHPLVKLILDVKAMAGEYATAAEVIRANADHLAHFHANDPNRRAPGYGDADFTPILAALAEARYAGWGVGRGVRLRPRPRDDGARVPGVPQEL